MGFFFVILEYGLVVLCSSENEDCAHIAAALDQDRVRGLARCPSPKEIGFYLQQKLCAPQQLPVVYNGQQISWRAAAELDQNNR